jgi:hypothetical protein
MNEISVSIKKLKTENKNLKKIKEEFEKRYKEDCAIRFGQEIDLDRVVQVGETEAVKKLKKNLDLTERACLAKIRKAEDELLKSRKRLQESVAKNTNLLNKITDLGNQKFDLQKKIDTTKKQVFVIC